MGHTSWSEEHSAVVMMVSQADASHDIAAFMYLQFEFTVDVFSVPRVNFDMSSEVKIAFIIT